MSVVREPREQRMPEGSTDDHEAEPAASVAALASQIATKGAELNRRLAEPGEPER